MVQNKIISWYLKNKRSLPWRNTQNPYFIWISEIILQQTRVAQGLPYYERFVEKFPRIEDMAAASEEEVLRLWQGLGYYSRGRNLHQTARDIVQRLNGLFPSTYAEIIKLKGVGPYTAAAIASFAFGERVPVVDGNVLRVMSRLFKIREGIDLPKTQAQIRTVLEEWIQTVPPDTFNQAIMEFGATLCTPKNPNCTQCPVQNHCLSFPEKDYLSLPIKAKKTKVLERRINYIVYTKEDKYFLKRRSEADIWKNLYDFPEGEPMHILHSYPPITHLLSHRKLEIYFYHCALDDASALPASGQWFTVEEIHRLPKPKVIADFFPS